MRRLVSIEKFTLAELDEEEAELDKLQRWHERIRAGDVHGAAGADAAARALRQAQDALERYSEAVFEPHSPDHGARPRAHASGGMARSRLRARRAGCARTMAPVERVLERDAELALLEQAVRGLAERRGCLVLVGGEAGIGKTTLVRALRARVGEEVEFLVGACEALSVPVPLGPWRELTEAAGHVDLAASERSDRLLLVRRLLAALADRAPVVAVIEDAHWADPTTLDVLRLLARRVESAPVAVVVTYRDDEDFVRALAEPARWPWLQPPPDGPRVPRERIAAVERAYGVVRHAPPPGDRKEEPATRSASAR